MESNLQHVDVVHRFTLQRRVASSLNERLVKLAEIKETLALDVEVLAFKKLVHTPPGPGSDAGVVLTNKGGYQSYHDLFEDGSPEACTELRDLVSVALTEIVALEHGGRRRAVAESATKLISVDALAAIVEAYVTLAPDSVYETEGEVGTDVGLKMEL